MTRHPQITALLLNSLSNRPEPFSLVHFVTERCNARCRHCFVDFANPADAACELSLDEIERLTRRMGRALYNVNLTGGEPFIRDDILDIARCYQSNTPVGSIVITTNGWFTDKIASFVERYTPLDTRCTVTISISVDDREKEHDGGRALSGLHARALESYRIVSGSADPRIRADIALTVTDANAGRIVDIYQDLRKSGLANVSPILLREQGVMRTIAGKSAIADAFRKLAALTDQATDDRRAGFAGALHRAKNRISHRILSDSCRHPRFLSPCRGGSLFASVAADGSVSPCELLAAGMPVGNLRDYDMDFLKLWHDQPARSARQSIHATRCHCTFECAWTVNILTTPSHWPQLLLHTARELS